MPPLIVATRMGAAAGSLEAAAALAVASSAAGRSSLLVELDDCRPRGPTILSSAPAREVEATVASAFAGTGIRPAARGQVCHLSLTPHEEGLATVATAIAALPGHSVCVLHLPPALLRPALDRDGLWPCGALLRADLDRDRSLAALAAGDLSATGLRTRIARRPLGWLAGRRALAGLPPGAAAEREADRLLAGLLGGAGPLPVGAVEGSATDA